jgi:hypothetical protein
VLVHIRCPCLRLCLHIQPLCCERSKDYASVCPVGRCGSQAATALSSKSLVRKSVATSFSTCVFGSGSGSGCCCNGTQFSAPPQLPVGQCSVNDTRSLVDWSGQTEATTHDDRPLLGLAC